MAHIFISYKRDTPSKRFVNKMREYLREAGFEPWIDTAELQAGEDWREAIDEAIREALAVIVVLTPGAVASQYVTYEWAFAFGVGKDVIPILYKDAQLHPRLVGRHYFDFTGSGAHPWNLLINRLRQLDSQEPNITQPAIRDKTDSMDMYPDYDQLIEGLFAEYSVGRQKAVMKIARIGKPIVPYLIPILLNESYWGARYGVAMALGIIKDVESTPALIKALKDTNENVRRASINALEAIGTPEALNAIQTEDIEPPDDLPF